MACVVRQVLLSRDRAAIDGTGVTGPPGARSSQRSRHDQWWLYRQAHRPQERSTVAPGVASVAGRGDRPTLAAAARRQVAGGGIHMSQVNVNRGPAPPASERLWIRPRHHRRDPRDRIGPLLLVFNNAGTTPTTGMAVGTPAKRENDTDAQRMARGEVRLARWTSPEQKPRREAGALSCAARFLDTRPPSGTTWHSHRLSASIPVASAGCAPGGSSPNRTGIS